MIFSLFKKSEKPFYSSMYPRGIKVHPLLKSGRFLFVVDGCDMCAVWKQFIYSLNMELKIDKQIDVIDCTDYYKYGLHIGEVFRLFNPFIQGHFPMLFIDGGRKYGTTSFLEADSWIRSRLNQDFLFRQNNPELNTNCKYIESGKLKGEIICN